MTALSYHIAILGYPLRAKTLALSETEGSGMEAQIATSWHQDPQANPHGDLLLLLPLSFCLAMAMQGGGAKDCLRDPISLTRNGRRSSEAIRTLLRYFFVVYILLLPRIL